MFALSRKKKHQEGFFGALPFASSAAGGDKPVRTCHGRLNLFGWCAQKKKTASSHARNFKALTMHARKTRTAPPHHTFSPLFLAFRNALQSHAPTRLRARTTNTHTTTHTCTLLCLFSREQAESLHVLRHLWQGTQPRR